jgi:hypothetical protein
MSTTSPPTPPTWLTSPTAPDGGYALVLGALALVPLVAVLALAIDLTTWQARAAALQRAADAAATAGVPLLPSVGRATEVAREVAGRNGVIHGTAGVDVAVVALGPAELEVRVTARGVRRWFAAPFTDAPDIERRAVAEYVPSVALGSPRNVLGSGSLAGTADPYRGQPGLPAGSAEDVWLAVNGPCASREQGDWLLPVSTANFMSGNPPIGFPYWRACTSTGDPLVRMVSSHDATGYVVGLRVPERYPGGPFTVQVFDASRCAGSKADYGATEAPFWTRFVVRGADATPALPLDNPVISSRTFATGDACGTAAATSFACGSGSWQDRWCNLATINDPLPGATYLMQVDTGPVSTSSQHRLNGFGVRVRSGAAVATGGFETCTVDPFDRSVAYRPDTCVQVHGVSWLSVFAFGDEPRPTFDLVEVGPEHGGATLEASLFDVGEGTVGLQILDPLGTPSAFSWEVVDETGNDTAPTGGWAGVVPMGGSLDTRGLATTDACGSGNPQPGRGRWSSSLYNDRMLRLRLLLPVDIDAAYGGRRWWRVRYTSCASHEVTDRTTWGARVVGEPVRLVR